jgi:hypothetical protein
MSIMVSTPFFFVYLIRSGTHPVANPFAMENFGGFFGASAGLIAPKQQEQQGNPEASCRALGDKSMPSNPFTEYCFLRSGWRASSP